MDSQQPNDRMDTRNRIRDTAGQDQVRTAPANPNRRRWLVGGIAGVVESTAPLMMAFCCSLDRSLYSASHFWAKPWTIFITLLS